MDPLIALPAEIVLGILDFTPVSGVASLTRLSRAWHDFVDGIHQDAIYSSLSKTEHPPGAKDLSFLAQIESFDQYFEGTASWKELCKRQTLLQGNYGSAHPVITDNFMVPLFDANRVWRFRTDLKRRFFVCTSQDGGLTVTDVDGKGRLWHLDHEEVPPFAHLEYADGMAVWSTLGDTLEVWKTDEADLPRGTFRKVAALHCPLHHLRGFHLMERTLCVVGDDGHGLVYDMSRDPPHLRLKLDIREGAVGHLCQAEDVVMYSMGQSGFDIHDKATGAFMSQLDPTRVKNIHHIVHPDPPRIRDLGAPQRSIPPLSSYTLHSEEAHELLRPIEVQNDPLPPIDSDEVVRTPIDQDDWGAGLISGNLMVGISKAGRVLVCANWREAIKGESEFVRNTSIIECEDNDRNFTLGGWLSIRDNRILFEILDKVYLISLNDDGTVATASQKGERPSWCFSSALNPLFQMRLQNGISMMQLFDDCLMTTCWVRQLLTCHCFLADSVS